MKNDDKGYYVFLFIIGLIIVIWFSLLISPILDKGLLKIIFGLFKSIEKPFDISWNSNSINAIIIFAGLYILIILYLLATKRNYRKNEEHGSAKWGNVKAINKKYMQKPFSSNKILTKKVCIGFNGRIHHRNVNTIVIGGSGAGKTRFYAKPNVMQANTSYVILDPKGEIVRAEGHLLERLGYEVKVLDFVNMEKSHCYNPFVYLQTDNDVQKLVTNIFNSTTPKGSQSSDPFWDSSASMLLLALIFYLWYEAPEEEQNFSMVMEMILAGEVKEDEEGFVSPLDILFNQLEIENPDHIALKYYRGYRTGSGKTLKSIQITLIARMEKFNLHSMASLTQTDELDLPSIGEKKTALFAIIPDNDKSFNFLISILYTQLFQHLFYIADYKYDGRLPVHVHFLMDEFANVSLPDDFQNILSVMRSREISVSIILQNLSQLKKLFEKDWESIVGNCDEFLYLGGNEQSTHKYVSEILGKATIDFNTYGKTGGKNGNASTNYQITGRDLLSPDEVRQVDDDHAVLLIRGEKPIYDRKYQIKKHPNVKYTTDGKGKPYIHGNVSNSIATVKLDLDSARWDNNSTNDDYSSDFEILSSEEFERKRK